jgi:hypothetical protein
VHLHWRRTFDLYIFIHLLLCNRLCFALHGLHPWLLKLNTVGVRINHIKYLAAFFAPIFKAIFEFLPLHSVERVRVRFFAPIFKAISEFLPLHPVERVRVRFSASISQSIFEFLPLHSLERARVRFSASISQSIFEFSLSTKWRG